MKKQSESELTYRDGDSGVKYIFRGPKIDWGVILMLPGQALGGHYHEEVEETFYVAQGEGVFIIDGETHPAREGDAFRMDPRDRHDILNNTQAPLKLIFIKCPYLPQDKVNL